MDDMNRSCRDFTAVLASGEPTPGGGGAAALCGAVGVALALFSIHLKKRRAFA